MVSPHSPTSSNSSALFGSEDPSFLEALGTAVLPGDVPHQAHDGDAQRLSSSPSPILESSSLEPPPCAQPTSNARPCIGSDDEELHATRTPSRAGLHRRDDPFVISDDEELSKSQSDFPPLAQLRYRKRAHSVSSNDERAHSPIAGVSGSHLDSDAYGASRFGEFGEYMRRKRAKLQIQNAEMGDTSRGEASRSQLFKGLAIYVGTRLWLHDIIH